MKTFETPKIEVVTFVAESIMNESLKGGNQLPWA
jgi:hypothetical protein